MPTTRPARDLQPGDVITVHGRVIRTVDRVAPTEYETPRPTVSVRYRQGSVPGVWSGGNTFGADEPVPVHVGATHVVDYLRCSKRCDYSVWLDSERPGDDCPVCSGALVYDTTRAVVAS